MKINKGELSYILYSEFKDSDWYIYWDKEYAHLKDSQLLVVWYAKYENYTYFDYGHLIKLMKSKSVANSLPYSALLKEADALYFKRICEEFITDVDILFGK